MIKEKLAKLIDLKSIITLIMTISLVVGFFKGQVTAEQFVPFATMIFMFYFQKDKKKNDTNGVG